MKMKFSGILISFLLLFYLGMAFAFTIPTRPDNYVNDYAGMLSTNAKDRLNQKLADFEHRTSNQLVVVTIPSLDNQPIEDYSIHLADRWKIGTREHNNGVILLLSKADHKIRIEVGYGLEGALPDATSELIIENEMRPAFRQGDFDAGIERGVDAIILATQNEYHANNTSSYSNNRAASSNGFSYFDFIIVALFVGIFLLRIIGMIRAGILYSLGRTGHIHTPFWDFFAGGVSSGGGGGGGFSGGFGGGGGGGFGGGGASGSW